jgi:hypothetical protein
MRCSQYGNAIVQAKLHVVEDNFVKAFKIRLPFLVSPMYDLSVPSSDSHK